MVDPGVPLSGRTPKSVVDKLVTKKTTSTAIKGENVEANLLGLLISKRSENYIPGLGLKNWENSSRSFAVKCLKHTNFPLRSVPAGIWQTFNHSP